jgi:DNA helicase-4
VVQNLIALSNLKGNIQHRVHQHNEAVAKKRAEAAYALIGDVEGRRLDEQQLNCIVKKAHNHLVIAGAGTGKTTTVVGKIKYLLKSNQCRPEDILVLSFTNASASEMSERIRSETGFPIQASTFHKLGLNIIAKVNGIMPKITRLDLHKFVRVQLELLMRSEAYLARLGGYLLYGRSNAKSEFDFETKAEYEKYLQTNPPTTINHEVVKSYGEMDIANFLNHNGILYLYEHEYEADTRTEEHAQYHPDFYLPEYKIYIEYFGINRKGEVPSYFSDKDGVVLVDYKSNFVDNRKEEEDVQRLVRRYRPQLLIYNEALEKISGQKVKEMYLYLFSAGKAVEIFEQEERSQHDDTKE